MTTTIGQMRELLEELGHVCFVNEERSELLIRGHLDAHLIHAAVTVEEEGRWFQLESVLGTRCTGDRTRRLRIMQTLLALNYELRQLKLSVDPRDGMITASAETWCADVEPTKGLVEVVADCFISGVRDAIERLEQALAPGTLLPQEAGDRGPALGTEGEAAK